MGDYEILEADPGDAVTLANLQADVLRTRLGKILGLGHPATGVIDILSMERSWRNALAAQVPVWVAFCGDDPAGMSAILPGKDKTVGEFVLEFHPQEANKPLGLALLDAAVAKGREMSLRAFGMWVLTGDDDYIRFLSDAGFSPQGLMQKLETPEGEPAVPSGTEHAPLEAHLWGMLL